MITAFCGTLLLARFCSTLLAANGSPADSHAVPEMTQQDSPVASSLRGLSVVSDQIAWASGAAGVVLRTIDGGTTWKQCSSPATELDFRSLHAFDAEQACVLSAGQPAILFRTSDGGLTWREVYRCRHQQAFFDGMQFWDDRRGLAFSDPLDARLLIISTTDGGQSWQELAVRDRPSCLDSEAGFAASNSSLTLGPGGRVWIGLGGQSTRSARILSSSDYGGTWTANESGLRSSASAGIFSLRIRPDGVGVATGGDYQQPAIRDRIAARTVDGGKSWTLLKTRGPGGFRSGVDWVPKTRSWVAVGVEGADWSSDDGQTWNDWPIRGFHAVRFESGGSGWAVGAAGKIGRITWKATREAPLP